MKHSTLKYAAFSITLLSATFANAGEWTGNVGGYLGQKTLDDKDWPQHDEHGSVGLILDIKHKDWPVSIAIDLFGTGDEDKHANNKHEAYTAEAHIGLRKSFKLPIPDCKLRPYVGAGVALIHAEEKHNSSGVSVSADDASHGYWVGTGTYFKVTDKFNLGLDLRYSEAELTLNNTEREAGGMNVSLGAGYHW